LAPYLSVYPPVLQRCTKFLRQVPERIVTFVYGLHARASTGMSNFVILWGLVRVLRKLLCHVLAVIGRHCVTLWLFSNCSAFDVYGVSKHHWFSGP
jgi:hypothetical protein